MGVKIFRIELTQVICYLKIKKEIYLQLPDPPKSLYALKKEELKRNRRVHMNHIKKA